MEPRTIQNFRLVEKLGEGGMGEVFLGLDVMLEREVAVKALRPELMSRPDIVERFRSEAIALAKLNHPNIAMLYSFINFEEQFFMVMEYVPGETLGHHLQRQGTMHWAEAARLICQVLRGIEHAHQMGIIHRDIKPANIILTADGIPKLMDFGIARILQTARLTQVGQLVGTLEYISPEQVEGKETDSRSDLYSLGAVFYEMLTGQLPFKKNTDYELIKAQIEESPTAPGRIISDIPSRLEKTVLRMLHKNPEKRFPSATACLTELEYILSLTPSNAAPRQKEAMPSFLKTYWKKYPGVFVLIITAGIACIILVLVLLDFLSTEDKPIPSSVIPSPSFVEQVPLKPDLPAVQAVPPETTKKNIPPSDSLKRAPDPLPPPPSISRKAPSNPSEKSRKNVSTAPQPKNIEKTKPADPTENQQKGWSIRK